MFHVRKRAAKISLPTKRSKRHLSVSQIRNECGFNVTWLDVHSVYAGVNTEVVDIGQIIDEVSDCHGPRLGDTVKD